MKYLKRINEIVILRGNQEFEEEVWDINKKDIEKIGNYKDFEVFHDKFYTSKYIFFKRDIPVIIVIINDFDGYQQIQAINVDRQYRGQDYSVVAYEFFINYFGKIVSDNMQTIGAKISWEKLFLLNKYKLYSLDIPFSRSIKIPIITDEDFENCYINKRTTILAEK